MPRYMQSRRLMVVTNSSCGWYRRKETSLLGGQWVLVLFIPSAYAWIYKWVHIPRYIMFTYPMVYSYGLYSERAVNRSEWV